MGHTERSAQNSLKNRQWVHLITKFDIPLLKAGESTPSSDFLTQYFVTQIYLTYKTASRILNPCKSKFLSNQIAITSQQMKYFMSHLTLGPLLQAYIRMLVAFNTDYPYCIELNTNVLKMLGKLSDEQIVAARKNPDEAKLSDKDKAMLKFVVKAVSAPEEVEAKDIDMLRQIGWTDSDIFDAAMMGANMVAIGMLFTVFKMHEAC